LFRFSLHPPCGLRLSNGQLSSGLNLRALDSPACAFESALRLGLPRSACASRFFTQPSDPASASPSGVSRLAPGTSLRVFRSEPALANQSFRCLSDRSSTPGLHPLLPLDPPACLPDRPQACALLRPLQLPSLCADRLAPVCSPSGSAAGLSVIHDSRLAPRALPTGPFRIWPTTYCVVISCKDCRHGPPVHASANRMISVDIS